MKNTYTYKEILLGLRKEYILLQEQLDSLKRYILLEENNLGQVKFSLSNQLAEDRVRMLCTLYDKKSKLEMMLERLKIDLGICPNYSVSYVNEKNGEYIIEEYSEIIDKSKRSEFNQSVFYILNSDFGKNMKFIHSGIGYDNIPYLSVGSHGISIYLNGFGKLSFDPSRDFDVHAHSISGILTKEKIEYMFNMEFSRKKFPEYYQNLIEDSNSSDKTLDIVGNFRYSKGADLEIIEDSKKLVLIKK